MAITLAHHKTGGNSSGSSFALTAITSTTLHNLLFAFVTYFTSPAVDVTTITVTDNQSGTWVLPAGSRAYTTGQGGGAIAYCLDAKSGVTSVTATMSGGGTSGLAGIAICFAEFTGDTWSARSTDGISGVSVALSTTISTSVTTTTNNPVVFCGVNCGPTQNGLVGGFTAIDNPAFLGNVNGGDCFLVPSAPTTATGGFTFTAARAATAHIVAIAGTSATANFGWSIPPFFLGSKS